MITFVPSLVVIILAAVTRAKFWGFPPNKAAMTSGQLSLYRFTFDVAVLKWSCFSCSMIWLTDFEMLATSL